MNNVKLYINEKDSKTEWGIWFEDGSVTNLMTPAPKKAYISNKSSLEHGRQVLTGKIPMDDERDITLFFALRARSLAEFYVKYHKFCDELRKGTMDIRIDVCDGDTNFSITFHLLYLSCQQYVEFNGRLAKFSLKMNEPNPRNRNITHSNDIVL